MFDVIEEENLFGEDTWEAAESTMQKEACTLALGKAHMKPEDIRFLYGGDLLRQGAATSMGVEELKIPMFGLYGACSTSGEALALASMGVAAGYGEAMRLQLPPVISEARKRNFVSRLVMPVKDRYWTLELTGAEILLWERKKVMFGSQELQLVGNRGLWFEGFAEYGHAWLRQHVIQSHRISMILIGYRRIMTESSPEIWGMWGRVFCLI